MGRGRSGARSARDAPKLRRPRFCDRARAWPPHPPLPRARHTRRPDLGAGGDLIGIRLFGASWGWRDDIFEGCPLSDGGRVLLGPIWFFYAAQLLFTLQRLLGARVHGVAADAPLVRARDKPERHLSLIVDRWKRQHDVLEQYAEILATFGADAAEGDRLVMDRLTAALQIFTDAVPDWVAAIPEPDIRFASQLHAI